MTWSCHHTMEMPSRRCISCCALRPRNYVLCAARGGTPERFRWLCDPCLSEYQSKGMLDGRRRARIESNVAPVQSTLGRVVALSQYRDPSGHFTRAYNQKKGAL